VLVDARGLLIVIGGIGASYPAIYSKIRTIAATAKLWDVSRKEVFQANVEPRSLSLIAGHVRDNVRFALINCPRKVRSAVIDSLPKDLVDDKLEFRLPKFQALIFVRQGPPRRKKQRS
jgi:hypothetical protein